jgi:DNA-directed RNA polymerase
MNAFEIIEDFISKRELTCPTEFRAWQTLKAELAQQQTTEQSTPCDHRNMVAVSEYRCRDCGWVSSTFEE